MRKAGQGEAHSESIFEQRMRDFFHDELSSTKDHLCVSRIIPARAQAGVEELVGESKKMG